MKSKDKIHRVFALSFSIMTRLLIFRRAQTRDRSILIEQDKQTKSLQLIANAPQGFRSAAITRNASCMRLCDATRRTNLRGVTTCLMHARASTPEYDARISTKASQLRRRHDASSYVGQFTDG